MPVFAGRERGYFHFSEFADGGFGFQSEEASAVTNFLTFREAALDNRGGRFEGDVG